MTKKHKKNKKNKTISSTSGGTIKTQTTPTKTTYVAKKCHTGNTAIYTYPNGGTLYIGGWNNGATFDWNTHVIDLTGNEHKYWDIPIAYDEQSKAFLPFLMQSYAGWLSLPFPDYGTPKGLGTLEQWKGITNTIVDILKEKHDVLVACHGGHGRSGLFIAIVGYLLLAHTDPTWASPVEKLRDIHCSEAVETYGQEKYVYEILGLRISPKHVYDNDYLWYGRGSQYPASDYSYNVGSTFQDCPICGTQSLYVKEYGMCMTCRNSFEKQAPVRTDLTLEDIEGKTQWVEHSCGNDKCMGIWKAATCGHVVHDMLIYDGMCEECYRKYEDDKMYAEQHMHDIQNEEPEFQTVCALCGKTGQSAEEFGICFECSSRLVQGNLVDDVHNTITDPYKFISHSNCEDDHMCVGIVRADSCLHVVHNREVEDGLCPKCYAIKNRKPEVA